MQYRASLSQTEPWRLYRSPLDKRVRCRIYPYVRVAQDFVLERARTADAKAHSVSKLIQNDQR